MKRIYLTSEKNRWFDADLAESFAEDTYHDGRNRISRETGSQTEHETLYKTKKGVFILNRWSNWQGSTETYKEIEQREAIEWLLRNDHVEDALEIGGKEILDETEI